MDTLNDGVEWPMGYYYVLILGFGAIVLPFGLITQRDCIKRTALGRCLRRRPMSGWVWRKAQP